MYNIVPSSWQGSADQCMGEMAWLKQLGSNIYCALWQAWPKYDLPLGYDGYVISFHLESVDIEWLITQCHRLSVPVVVLSDSNYYDWPAPYNLKCLRYVYWHKQLRWMMDKFHIKSPKKIKYKASAFSNRITQSKLLIFTALITYLQQENCYLSLGDWVEERNIHHRQLTGRQTIDDLSKIFYDAYLGRKIQVDEFDPQISNVPTFTADPWGPAYQQSALNFTNESYHYSYQGNFIRPGPFLTEKTLKCLLGGTGMVSVGQFDTYSTLAKLGFKFDYEFDTSWDLLAGDLDRLTSIITLIKSFSNYSAEEIYLMTKMSSLHNQDHILSGDFAIECEKVNLSTSDQVIRYFKS